MKVIVLLAVAFTVCYLQPRYVTAQITTEADTLAQTTTEAVRNDSATTEEANTTDSGSGSGTGNMLYTDTDTDETGTGNVTTIAGGADTQNSRLATSEIVGIVVGVVALVILLALLTTIVIILTIKSSVKAKKAKISPVKQKPTSSTQKTVDSNIMSHGSYEPMKELPIVDS